MPQLDIYGQNHSPWVQAVLLGAHERGSSHSLRTAPPWSLFKQWGVMMPAASMDGEPWQLESASILQQLHFDAISPLDLKAIYTAWTGVLHRTDNAWRFFHRFSLAGDQNPSLPIRLRNNFLRSFATLYFFLLIRFRVSRLKQNEINSGDQFLYWERQLEAVEGPFLGGSTPNTPDFMLFGVIQCHCSIPVPPVAALQEDPRLNRVREWIGAMQNRFSGYQHLYSGAYFKPAPPPPAQASLLEQSVFWLGAAFMIACFPVTVPLIAYFVTHVPR